MLGDGSLGFVSEVALFEWSFSDSYVGCSQPTLLLREASRPCSKCRTSKHGCNLPTTGVCKCVVRNLHAEFTISKVYAVYIHGGVYAEEAMTRWFGCYVEVDT